MAFPWPKLCSRLYPFVLSTLKVSFSIFHLVRAARLSQSRLCRGRLASLDLLALDVAERLVGTLLVVEPLKGAEAVQLLAQALRRRRGRVAAARTPAANSSPKKSRNLKMRIAGPRSFAALRACARGPKARGASMMCAHGRNRPPIPLACERVRPSTGTRHALLGAVAGPLAARKRRRRRPRSPPRPRSARGSP